MGLQKLVTPEELETINKIHKLPTKLSSFTNDTHFINAEEAEKLIQDKIDQVNNTTAVPVAVATADETNTAKLETLNTLINTKYQEVNSSINNLQNQFTKEKENTNTLSSKIETINKDLTSLKTNLNSINTNLTNLTKTVSNQGGINFDASTYENQLKSQEKLIQAAQKNIDTLSSELEAAKETFSNQLKNQKTEIDKQITVLLNKINDVTNTIKNDKCNCYHHHLTIDSIIDDYSINLTTFENVSLNNFSSLLKYLTNNNFYLGETATKSGMPALDSNFLPCSGIVFSSANNATKLIYGIAIKDDDTLVFLSSANDMPYIFELTSVCIDDKKFKDTIINK